MEVTNKQELIRYIEHEVQNERRYMSYADTDNGGRRLETYDNFAKEEEEYDPEIPHMFSHELIDSQRTTV